jgi:hypothetical protein
MKRDKSGEECGGVGGGDDGGAFLGVTADIRFVRDFPLSTTTFQCPYSSNSFDPSSTTMSLLQ